MSMIEKFKTMESTDLIQEKVKRLKNLQRLMQESSACDVTKGAERTKLLRIVNSITDELSHISLIEKVIKEKDF